MREQNLKLTEKQKQALLDQQKAAAAVELQRSLREKAYGLLGTAMERAGRGKEFAENQALRDAEKTKGSALTDAEKSLVRRLSKLTWDIQQKPRSGVSAEDFARGANELTARGGFIGGAGPRPDTSQIAREARDFNKRQAEAAEQIRSLLNDILRG